ncbi:unnamed protein product [Arabis nemorensis]|uniref:Uncharacterized protein n=1 Tax=Arabis nemorensis TaxID=586526 RepID=A0A565CEH1_9BRAS|nr:unnamed protein product [Arabis nemorensis]
MNRMRVSNGVMGREFVELRVVVKEVGFTRIHIDIQKLMGKALGRIFLYAYVAQTCDNGVRYHQLKFSAHSDL